MILNKKLIALFQLIDDPDPEVYQNVSNQLKSYGQELVPILEKLLETTIHEETQLRIESLIRKIVFERIKSEFIEWAEDSDPSLLKGALIISSYYFPQLDISLSIHDFDQMKRNVWLEMSMFLTPLEQINVLNSILYNYYKIEPIRKEHETPEIYTISNLMDFKVGNSLSIGILYLSLCEVLDIPIFAINIPQQFLLGYFDSLYNLYADSNLANDIQFYIDPEQGAVHTADEIFQFLKFNQQKELFPHLKALNNKEVIGVLIKELILKHDDRDELDAKQDMEHLRDILSRNL